jgi:hypothetical protein
MGCIQALAAPVQPLADFVPGIAATSLAEALE